MNDVADDSDDFHTEGEEAEGRRLALDAFARHEVLHTASVILDMFDAHILKREAVLYGSEELRMAAEKTNQALFDF